MVLLSLPSASFPTAHQSRSGQLVRRKSELDLRFLGPGFDYVTPDGPSASCRPCLRLTSMAKLANHHTGQVANTR
jgi:hypothetical protein